MKRTGVILAAICTYGLFACSSNENANKAQATGNAVGNTYNTSRGQELFQQKCQACHGLTGDYRNNNAANLQISKIDSTSVVNTIINGKGAMPMFDHVMPDSDLAQLELYVKTLRK